MTAYPCLVCKMSPRNSIHKNLTQFGYHEWVETPEETEEIMPPEVSDWLRDHGYEI